jgi:hypothetical protein
LQQAYDALEAGDLPKRIVSLLQSAPLRAIRAVRTHDLFEALPQAF